MIELHSSLHLSAKTKLSKEELKRLKIIANCLYQSNDAYAFREPVDWKNLGLTDYLSVIRYPMDLSSIQRRINEDKYEFAEEVLDDIQLIWDNCKLYNPSNSWIYTVAEKLERSFRKMVRNYFPDLEVTLPPKALEEKEVAEGMLDDEAEDITYQQKLKFSEELSYLSSASLGRVIDEVISKCPSAYRDTGEGRGQILVDQMDLIFFNQLSLMIRNMLKEAQAEQK